MHFGRAAKIILALLLAPAAPAFAALLQRHFGR
jgi:hypothetical protein